MRSWGLALLLLAGSAGAWGDSGPAPSRHLVEMRGMEFIPAKLVAHAGDTVIWINRDIVPHTATADDGSWTTGNLSHGDSVRRVVGEADGGPYHCELHPAMKARLTAER